MFMTNYCCPTLRTSKKTQYQSGCCPLCSEHFLFPSSSIWIFLPFNKTSQQFPTQNCNNHSLIIIWYLKILVTGIRLLCDIYSLPSPLMLLKNPPTKHFFNKLVKSRILDYWEKDLRSVAVSKSSLEYFKPSFMSLATPHPMFTTCSSTNSFKTNKSTCQASIISGRYKTDYLTRYWVKENPSGYCVCFTQDSWNLTL